MTLQSYSLCWVPYAHSGAFLKRTECNRQGSACLCCEGKTGQHKDSDPTPCVHIPQLCVALFQVPHGPEQNVFCTERLNVVCGRVCDGESVFLQNLVNPACAEDAGIWSKEFFLWRCTLCFSEAVKDHGKSFLWANCTMLILPYSFRDNLSQRRQVECFSGTF